MEFRGVRRVNKPQSGLFTRLMPRNSIKPALLTVFMEFSHCNNAYFPWRGAPRQGKVQGFCANKRKTLAALFSTHYLKALSKRILCNFIKNSKIPEQSGPHIFIANILGHCKGGANLVAGISNA